MTDFTLNPDPPSFGYIGAGFLYQLRCSLTNTGPVMDRFKIVIQNDDPEDPNTISCDYQVTSLAPGMNISFNLTLHANSCYETTYTMMITKSLSKVSDIKIISALIIPIDTFKKVSRLLMLRNLGIYAKGVKCAGQLNGENVGVSIISGAPTIYSEALIDDEELDVSSPAHLFSLITFPHSHPSTIILRN